MRLSRNIVCPRLVKRCSNVGQWDMHGQKFVDWTGFQPDMKLWKWLGESSMQSCWCGFFRTNFIIAIVLKNCVPKTGQTVPRLVKRFPNAEKWDMNGKTFVAAGGFVFTGKLLHTEAFTHRSFDTEKPLHRGAFTYRRVSTKKRLHTEAFTQSSFYTKKTFYTNKPVHREACTHRSFYTEQSFRQRNLYTEELSHREVFTQRRFYTQKLLHKETFTHRSFYTQKLLDKKLLHKQTCTHRSFYTQKLLHREVF